jgi:signal transduction histidine kinase/ligand-binding sensor domain-containing protein
MACCFNVAHALDPNRLLFQYVRQQWSSSTEFSGGSVNAIQQTPDGYLWIGTDQGLIRFDGFSFHLVQFPLPDAVPRSPILGLVADGGGGLWIQRQGAELLYYNGGHFEAITSGTSPSASQVTALSKDKNGDVLLADVSGGILRFHGTNFHRVAPPDVWRGSTVISIAETGDGNIWMGTLGAGLFSLSPGHDGNVRGGLLPGKINCLLPGAQLWAGTDDGLYQWNGTSFLRTELPSVLRGVQVLSMLRDRDSNVWVGTARGLFRINANGIAFSEENELRGSGGINTLFEDREGNLWVGGARGLGRIRDSVFVSYSTAGGVSFAHPGPVFVDGENRAWFAPAEGGIYFLKNGQIQRVTSDKLAKDVIYSIGGREDEIWIGRQQGGLTRLRFRNGTLKTQTYTEAQGLAQNSVYSVFQSNDGTVWAGTLSAGVSRLKDGQFINYTTASGLAASTVSSILETRDGTMWFGTANGVSSLSNGHWRTYASKDGLPSEQVNCLFEDLSGTLWAGTSAGLAVFRSERFQAPSEWPAVLHEPLSGLAEDKNGALWMATSTHVLKVSRDKLLAGGIREADIRLYGTADGLRSKQGVNRSRSVICDSAGRVWLSLSSGLSVVDPSHLAETLPPAIAHVETVLADGKQIQMGSLVRIPPSQKRLTFGYTGLSLAIPTRIRFRYMLEGFDRGWSEPVLAREAIYTNLGPGTYRFRVMASNSRVWDGLEAAIPLEVEPALWQAWWFRSVLLVLAGFTALLIYRLRLRQLTHELHMRFEERLAERTRIAQELHDTLLQGFLSASMQLHVADERLPDNSPAKPLVGRVLELMKDVIDESRNVVRGLRSPAEMSCDLDEAFSRVPEQLGVKQTFDFRVIVEGHPRMLRPSIRDDVYRMGREALVNAFRHSGGNTIQLELEYGSKELRVLIRDNGSGIDEQVLRSGREGHWGLPGMRERAERIGAQLKVWSQPARGTEVELIVPAHIAFESNSSGAASNWLKRLRARKTAADTNEKKRAVSR